MTPTSKEAVIFCAPRQSVSMAAFEAESESLIVETNMEIDSEDNARGFVDTSELSRSGDSYSTQETSWGGCDLVSGCCRSVKVCFVTRDG